jgi:hypothetical protein
MAEHLNLGYFGNIWVRQNILLKSGEESVGHKHKFDHVTLLTNGEAEVSVEGREPKVFKAPTFIIIRKEDKHTFKALTDNVTWFCIFALRDLNGEVIPELYSEDHDPKVLNESGAKVADDYWEYLERNTTDTRDSNG